MKCLLWIILPYSSFLSFAAGHLWRYRRDRFQGSDPGAETDRSELLGAMMFRLGIVLVLLSRITIALTSKPDPPGAVYTATFAVKVVAVPLTILGALVLFGPSLVAGGPRTIVSPVDRFTLPMLTATALSSAAVGFAPDPDDTEYHSATMIFAWFRSLITLHPLPDTMVHTPLPYQIRALTLMVLVAIWPYTRLGGTFVAPVIRALDRLRNRPAAKTPIALAHNISRQRPGWRAARIIRRTVDDDASRGEENSSAAMDFSLTAGARPGGRS
ncbi:respiratory nitrate reductase subunit gamma [Nocardia terpenica]|uniref:respiratory nitrate reductase subunit gamma n=1 Tax=Nocardia terpenica TaxID=455432 RepID=UPI002FE2E18D